MANHSAPWTLPPSFMPPDPSSNGLTSMKHAEIAKPLTDNGGGDDDVLHITIHQAKQIHNICIYGKQDVYAKFLFTDRQDAVYPTKPVKAGGQNPVFNQSLEIPISARPDTVLKCELWMMSCAQGYLEDQLLGFVLVPLQTIYGKGEQTREYCLTSTDLFYTPAGSVQLSLALFDHGGIQMAGGDMVPEDVEVPFGPPSPEFHEVLTAPDLCKVEFPDLEAASEDQHLVSMYYKLGAAAGAVFEEPNESGKSSVLPGSTTDIEPDKAAGHGNLCDSDKHHGSAASQVNDPSMTGVCGGATAPIEVGSSRKQPTSSTSASSAGVECIRSNPSPPSAVTKEKQEREESSPICPANQAGAVAIPHAEPEVPIGQEHFVDLYLKSMRQFTDKLVDMRFSFNIDAKDIAALRSVQVDKVTDSRKKEGASKLYYGSRAFY